MAIYILEDEPLQANFLEQYIRDYQIRYAKNSAISVFNRTNSLITAINCVEKNLYFLDIQIKGELHAGLMSAKIIRKMDPTGLIAFVTSHQEFALEALQSMVSAIMFIYKNVDMKTFTRQIDQVLTHYFNMNVQIDEEIFTFQTKQAYVNERLNDILYFEVTGNHQITMMTKYKLLQFYGTLKELEQKSDTFIRIHQAYLVNRVNIRSYQKKQKQIEMLNGENLPVSRTYAKQIEAFFRERR